MSESEENQSRSWRQWAKDWILASTAFKFAYDGFQAAFQFIMEHSDEAVRGFIKLIKLILKLFGLLAALWAIVTYYRKEEKEKREQ